ncbi:hypothetical protein BC332_34652 [Capsicum chinense]|nr:hypothetical protein BC332_34652 [Capsicum chinense]
MLLKLEDFLTSLKNLSINCQFGNLKDSITKDLFIGDLYVKNQNIKEELIKSEESSLDKIFTLAQKLQLAKERSEILDKQVNALDNSQHHQPMSQPSRSRYRRRSSSSSSRDRSPSHYHRRNSSNNRYSPRHYNRSKHGSPYPYRSPQRTSHRRVTAAAHTHPEKAHHLIDIHLMNVQNVATLIIDLSVQP